MQTLSLIFRIYRILILYSRVRQLYRISTVMVKTTSSGVTLKLAKMPFG